jgi:uncharacterized membrane protein
LALVTVACLGPPFAASLAHAEDRKKDLPARGISVAPEYTGIIVAQGEGVTVDLNVINRGRQDESIELTVHSVPEGWSARIKTYSFAVTGVFVPGDQSKTLTLEAEPNESVSPGKYIFSIRGQTRDSKLNSSAELQVTVQEKEHIPEGLHITTSYPVLQGPSDARFEFSLEVENKTDKDSIFNLSAQCPENWEVQFKPAYEQKFISSLRIKSNQTETMAVDVKPYPLAEPGQYPVKVSVSSPESKAEVELTVSITGTYKLEVATSDGLLSLGALRGKKANLSFYVKNTGTAAQNHVRFLSFKPENWEVKFTPENLKGLAPGDLMQVEVTITPAEQALVGDYSVGLSVEGEKVTKDLELRVTVRASTAWGWVGIGIIAVVIAGLVTLFVRLGRR